MICGKRRLYPFVVNYGETMLSTDRRYHVCGRPRGHEGKHTCWLCAQTGLRRTAWRTP